MENLHYINYMTRVHLSLLFVVVLCSTTRLSAQIYTTGKEDKKADVNFAELANYYQSHPISVYRKPLFDEDEEDERPEPAEPNPSEIHMLNKPAARPGGVGGTYLPMLPVSPSPGDTFLASISDGTGIPPDTYGEVDSTYCVTSVNTEIKIQKKNGVSVYANSLDGFWHTVMSHGTGAFDPRVHYDPYYKRWIMVAVAYGQTTYSTLMVGVSATSNPTGTWHLYSIVTDPSGQSWLDFPISGFNKRWITITGNYFRNTSGVGPQGAVVFVFDYASIMAGTGAPYTKITESSEFCLAPARTYDTAMQNMFMVEVSNGNTGKLRLWKISGTTGSPTVASVGYPTSAQKWHGGGNGDFVPQLGTTNKLQAGDGRIHSFVCRNNSLWTAHTVFLPNPGTANRCSIMWWQIDTLANPVQNGLIDDATTPKFFDYPSICVNKYNDALIGFSYQSSAMHSSAAYALRMHTDPLDSFRPPHIYRHGQATYYQTFGGSQDRWGDYSNTCVDPANGMDFWTIQECVPVSPTNYWDTWWASVKICPVSAQFTVTKDTVYKGAYDTITYTGTSPAGSTYSWTFGGGTATPGTGVGPHRVKWTTKGWHVITVSVTDSGCTSVYTDSVYVKSTVGVDEVTLKNGNFDILPNPNDGSFSIVLAAPISQTAYVKILDMQGRIVYKNTFSNQYQDKIPVTTKDLAPGNYMVSLNLDGVEYTNKITIAR